MTNEGATAARPGVTPAGDEASTTNPWLIGVLGLLSVMGVMLGIYLRLQSFLYTGVGFLALSLALLIYHASVNLHQTWLLWLAGVALGVAILAAFAMFERHKQKITQVLEHVRGWEG